MTGRCSELCYESLRKFPTSTRLCFLILYLFHANFCSPDGYFKYATMMEEEWRDIPPSGRPPPNDDDQTNVHSLQLGEFRGESDTLSL